MRYPYGYQYKRGVKKKRILLLTIVITLTTSIAVPTDALEVKSPEPIYEYVNGSTENI